MELVYPLNKKYLAIDRAKKSFHAEAPQTILIQGGIVDHKCSQLLLSFQVLLTSHIIIYSLDDFSDECLPFNVEGKWRLKGGSAQIEEDFWEFSKG